MYKQTINQIQLVIVPLDGVIFDFNKYRYNYYRHLCENKNIQLSKMEFYTHLSNMYDMYKGLPLTQNQDVGPLNAKIEREMMQYLDYKGIQPKEGFIELLEYLHQKQIPVAVISTHRTKDAVHYLKSAKLYNKVQYIIGSDTCSHPLPSPLMLEMIQNNFHIESKHTLVLSSFMALNKAANELHMNVIYCNDLIEGGDLEKETSYKIAKNLFDVLNILLFDKYDDVELYSPILGMNSKMNKNQLDQMHDKLKETYQDDQQIIHLVDQTYAYHISQLNNTSPQQTSSVETNIQEPAPKKKFVFEDDDDDDDSILLQTRETIHEETNETPENSSSDVHIATLDKQEEETLNYLLQQINKPKKTDKILETSQSTEESYKEEDDEIDDGNDDCVENKNIISTPIIFIINLLYVFAISFIITFTGLIFAIIFYNQLNNPSGLFNIIYHAFEIYYSCIEIIFSTIFNLLHSIISFIPDYTHYSTNNSIFSPQGIQLFNIFIFQAIIIGVFKIAFYLYKRRRQYDDIESH